MMAFRSKPSSFKIQLAEMSKRKQVQSSLNTFFGGKQDRESNTTPTAPAACSSDQGNTEVSRIMERKVQMAQIENNRRALTKEAKAFGLVTDPSISLYNYMGKIPVYT